MRILILRLSSLGDVALLAPVFEAIKRAYPQAHISCLVKPAYAGILASNPMVDEVIIFKGFWKTLMVLRQQSWDAALDLHAVVRTRLLMAFLPCGRKVTYRKDVLGRYWMLLGGQPSVSKHTLDRYHLALQSLGIGLKRLVVLQTAFLGDAVLTLPLLHQIKKRFHLESLAVVARPEHAALFERDGFTVIRDDKRGQDRGWQGFWRIANIIRQGRFDAALVPHRSLRSAVLAWAAGIPYRVGFASSAGWFFFNRRAPFVWPEHDADRNIRLLEAFGPPAHGNGVSPDAFEIPVRAQDRTRAEVIWRGFGIDPDQEFLIGMTPGSKWATKQWFPERFVQTAQSLKARHAQARILLVGGPEDEDLCGRIAGSIGEGAVNLAGRVALADWPALMRDLRLFITNDSGPMHIASGSGVPTVAIFGPTVQGFGFYPKGVCSRVVEAEDLDCRPCSLHGKQACPRGHFLCMRLITPEKVLRACEEVLSVDVKRKT